MRQKLERTRLTLAGIAGGESRLLPLRPPASEVCLRAFEEAHGIGLPEEYRLFLEEVTEDPGGPHYGWYGLYPFADVVSRYAHLIGDDLSRPCRLSAAEVQSHGWRQRWEAGQLPVEYYSGDGLLAIGPLGCTFVNALVVTGAARGLILNYDVSGFGGGMPYLVHQSFGDWFEATLDGILTRFTPPLHEA
jgi:hypothetical protein